MDTDEFTVLTRLADIYSEDIGIWDKETFRFKHHDNLGMSELEILYQNELIEKNNDWVQSTTTWCFTEDGTRLIATLERSVVTEMTDEQRQYVRLQSELLCGFPTEDTFHAKEFNLVGRSMQELHGRGFIEKAEDTTGRPALWQVTDLTRRVQAELC